MELELIDEGIADVPLHLEADLIGLTVITGTAQVNGAGSFPFVLEVTDPGKKGDTLTLRIDGLAQGYSASGVVQKKGTIGITTS